MNKIIKISAVLSLLMVAASAVAVAPAQVPATGETGGALGSDKGVAWPSPRFVPGSSSATADCITDKLTGLMWPKNGIIGFEATDGGGPIAQPDYANSTPNLNHLTWTQALTAVGNMNTATTKLCGYDDWRLPNKVELKSMINYGQANPGAWLNTTQGFIDVQNVTVDANEPLYWSSSTHASFTTNAWVVNFHLGSVDAPNKNASHYVWPVRGGQ